MKTILWLYNMPLVPEAGGTERITSLVRNGLLRKGYGCMKMLVANPKTSEIMYEGQNVPNLYAFLKKHHVDVVVNQDGITDKVLTVFLDKGGLQWRQDGGKIITCLHFDPDVPPVCKLFLSKKNKTMKDWLTIVKLQIFSSYYRRRKDKQAGKLYNELYDKSDFFVCLSKTHYPYLHKVMKRTCYKKMVAINNPLTFDDISNVSVLSKKKKQVLIVARMDEYYKRISLALKVWKQLQNIKDWQLVIVGDGPSLNDYREYVRKHHIQNVCFEGRQTPESYYIDSSIFMMTSDKEGWGLTLTESLQRGVVPVVMNSSPVFSEIILDGVNGFLTANNDVEKFADKIRFLMTNVGALYKMGRQALESASKFNIDNTIAQWEKIL